MSEQTPIDPMTPPADPSSPSLSDDRGLSIDMLDVDRLRQWATNIDTYGADLLHWTATLWFADKLRQLADYLELAVREIGSLREDAARLAAKDAEIARLRGALVNIVRYPSCAQEMAKVALQESR